MTKDNAEQHLAEISLNSPILNTIAPYLDIGNDSIVFNCNQL
ncbi:MAG: hypothetical protein AAF268_04690 [Cyanobacteria bacterium P01_A01_bin.3]